MLQLTNTLPSLIITAVLLLSRLAAADDQARPNFLFILTDDQEQASIGAYGNPTCRTPNIDRIAREGMLIRDAHHMGAFVGAVCRPSRTMIMTGRSVWRIPGAEKSGAVDVPAAREAAARSMAAVFNAAGYDTFRTCKRGNTFKEANKHFQICFDADRRKATPEGGSRWHGQHAVDFLEERQRNADSDPFLMFLGFSHPHDPRNGEQDLLNRYGAVNPDEPPEECLPGAPAVPDAWLPLHPFPTTHSNVRDEIKVPGVMEKRTPAVIRNETGREYACIELIDQEIGRVLSLLESSGQLENTYIFFTADHGIALGRHGLMGKQNLYEHTWRVPFLVRGPGISAGSEASGFIYLMDVLPTMCDLAGIPVPDGCDALSMRPVLEGKQERIRDVLYGVYSGGTKPGIRSIKTADGWKLIRYDSEDEDVLRTQLFNLNDNPEELLSEHHTPQVTAVTGRRPQPDQRDLADVPAYADRRRELESLLLSEQQRLGDPFELRSLSQ